MAAISPLEWLGIAMATRAKEAGERAKAKSAEEQALVNERLSKYGGDIGAFQKEWEYGYGPQQTSSQQQAQQFYDYWMDLPKTLEGAQKEQKGLGKASVLPSSPYIDPVQAFANWQRSQSLANSTPGDMGRTSADWSQAMQNNPALRQRPGSTLAPRARSLATPRSRVVRF